jgi:DNA polymerase-4
MNTLQPQRSHVMFAACPPPRAIIHLDVDAFFASVEQRDDPKLRGRPVAVGTGVVASCSYEARRWGVDTAMRLAEARHRCRELIVLPGDYPRYEQVGRQILAICKERTPLVEPAALDDLYLDLTQSTTGSTDRVIRELDEQVRDEIRVSVSLGMGSNKLVASVATKEVKRRKRSLTRQEPNPPAPFPKREGGDRGEGLLVPCGEEQPFLAPWPVRVLPGVGPKVETRLARLNVQRVGTVAGMPRPLLQVIFGNFGRQLSEYAHGIDLRPVRPDRPPQSISRCTSFDPPVSEPVFLAAMLDYLLERAASWLRFRDRATRGLTVSLRYGDYESTEGHERFARATDRDDTLREAAHACLGRIYTRRLPLRLLGVALCPLVSPLQQADLFADPADERTERLAACKDEIRRRFGFLALGNARMLKLMDTLEHDREQVRLRTPCLTR